MWPLVLFWALGVIWGSNFIYMKWASELVTVQQVVLIRVFFGFLPVLMYALYKRQIRLEHLRHSGHFLVMALIATILYYYGFAKGSSLLYSGVAGALSGSVPLFAFMLGVIFIAEEKATFNRWLGIAIGFLGVILIARPFDTDVAATNISGVLFMVVGSLSVGASFIYARRFITPLKIGSAALTSYQLGLALLILLLSTDLEGIGNIRQSTHVLIGTLLGLGILGTGLAYIIYYLIIEKLGAVTAASVTYIPPVVALIIGALFIGEDITWLDYLATGLIFAGVLLLNRDKARQRA